MKSRCPYCGKSVTAILTVDLKDGMYWCECQKGKNKLIE